LADFDRTGLTNGKKDQGITGQLEKEIFTLLVIQFLGVIQSFQAESLGKDDRRSHNRSGQGTSAGLVNSRNRVDASGTEFLLMKKSRPAFLSGPVGRNFPGTFLRHREK